MKAGFFKKFIWGPLLLGFLFSVNFYATMFQKLPVVKLSIPVATRDSNSKVMINKMVMQSKIIEK